MKRYRERSVLNEIEFGNYTIASILFVVSIILYFFLIYYIKLYLMFVQFYTIVHEVYRYIRRLDVKNEERLIFHVVFTKLNLEII